MTAMANAHLEWHLNTGVPMGPSGGVCPWDACGWLDDFDDEPTGPSDIEDGLTLMAEDAERERERADAEDDGLPF